eukprot:CAMPEP_0174241720 /NCGR_PEP_ID=MMETSP0417-20130205/24539_1 /TAXON_ID=242541 /ORGANISM="Mayorella sp, Strain BSH-02190019" /LENGTH=1422 /DNA_ID=CAMNT_0015321003 /DNA_START=179 /DNA_END=4443 /DNA_ORIENTATION=-
MTSTSASTSKVLKQQQSQPKEKHLKPTEDGDDAVSTTAAAVAAGGGASVFTFFHALSSLDEQERLSSAAQLMTYLAEAQERFEKNDPTRTEIKNDPHHAWTVKEEEWSTADARRGDPDHRRALKKRSRQLRAQAQNVSEEDLDSDATTTSDPKKHQQQQQQQQTQSNKKKKEAAENDAEHSYSDNDSDDDSDDEQEDAEEAELQAERGLWAACEDVRYALRRLTRGVCSGNECARQGFGAALTLLLRQHRAVLGVRAVLCSVCVSTRPHEQVRGVEERELLYGRATACMAIVRSELLLHGGAGAGGSQATQGRVRRAALGRLVPMLLDLSLRKHYLRELGCTLLMHLAAQLYPQEQRKRFHREMQPLLAEFLQRLPEEYLAADYALLVNLCELYSVHARALAGEHWLSEHPASPTHLRRVVHALKGSAEAHPRVHTVWDALLTPALREKHHSTHGVLHHVWPIVVDRGLFNGKSAQQKYLGFNLFGRLVNSLKAKDLPLLFTSHFLRCLYAHLPHASSELHSSAHHALAALLAAAEKSMPHRVALVSVLVRKANSASFDKRTNTETLAQLINGLNADGVWMFLDTLEAAFVEPIQEQEVTPLASMDETEEDGEETEDGEESDLQTQINTRRIWVCNQLLMLVRGGRIPVDDRCVGRIMGILLYHGFYSSGVYAADPESKAAQRERKSAEAQWKSAFADTNPTATHILSAVKSAAEAGLTLADEVRQVAAQRFFSVLSELHQIRHVTDSAPVAAASSSSSSSLSSSSSSSSPPSSSSSFASSASSPKRHSGTASDNELWVYHITVVWRKLLQVKCVTPVRESTKEFDVASEAMISVVKKIRQALQKPKSTNKGMRVQLHAFHLLFLYVGLQGLSEPEQSAENLQDLLECYQVSMRVSQKKQSKSSKSKKSQKNAFVEDSDDNYIAVLVDVLVSLLTRESALLRDVVVQVFRAFCHKMNEEALELLLDLISAKDSEDSNLIADMDESALSDAMLDAGDEEPEEGSGSTSDADDDEDDDIDMADSADVVLGDEEMFALDDKLSEIFRTLRKQRQAEAAVTRMKFHFKFRVLELLEVFIKRQPTHPLVLSLIEPLLRAYFAVGKEKNQRSLADKLSALLRNRICKAHEYPDVSANPKAVNDMLEKYFQLAWKHSSKEYRDLCTQVVHYLMRVLHASQSGKASEHGVLDVERFLELYKKALFEFMTKKHTNVNGSFFIEIGSRQPSVAIALASGVTYFCRTARTVFLRCQAFTLLSTLILRANSKQTKIAAVDDIVSVCADTLKDVHSNPTEWASKRSTEVLKSIMALMRVHRQQIANDTKFCKVWSDVFEEAEKLCAQTKGSSQKVCNLSRNVLSFRDSASQQQKKKSDKKVSSASKRKASEEPALALGTPSSKHSPAAQKKSKRTTEKRTSNGAASPSASSSSAV